MQDCAGPYHYQPGLRSRRLRRSWRAGPMHPVQAPPDCSACHACSTPLDNYPDADWVRDEIWLASVVPVSNVDATECWHCSVSMYRQDRGTPETCAVVRGKEAV